MKQITRSFTIELTARLKEKGALIQAVLGPRQVGKTTGVKQCLARIREVQSEGASEKRVEPIDITIMSGAVYV